jgi:hypothetical protein
MLRVPRFPAATLRIIRPPSRLQLAKDKGRTEAVALLKQHDAEE